MVDYKQMQAQSSSSAQSAAGYDEGLRQHMLKLYQNIALGLGLSALTAFMTLSIPALAQLVFTSPLGLVVQFAPLAILLFASFKMNSMSTGTLKKMFWAFCALKGMALSYVVLMYTGESVFRALALTAAIFGALSLYGYSTKRDLTSMGMFLGAGVLMLFLGFVGSWVFSLMGFETSGFQQLLFYVLGVVVIGLTVYETQQIKRNYYQLSGEGLEKATIMSTWSLYINIIIIFQWILSIMGNER